MSIFGRRANPSPTGQEVPPELRPYYDGQTGGARWRRTLSRALPLLIAVLLAVGIIGGAFWLRSHRTSVNEGTSSSTGTSQQQTQIHPGTGPGSTSGGDQAQVPNSTSPSGAQPSQTAQNPSSSSPSQATTQPTTIPNTGPGDLPIFLAFASGLVGVTLSYIRRLSSGSKA